MGAAIFVQSWVALKIFQEEISSTISALLKCFKLFPACNGHGWIWRILLLILNGSLALLLLVALSVAKMSPRFCG